MENADKIKNEIEELKQINGALEEEAIKFKQQLQVLEELYTFIISNKINVNKN